MADDARDSGERSGPQTRAIDTIVEGMSRTVGGWWTGRAASDAVSRYSSEEDSFYRERYSSSPHQLADRSFEDIRPAYLLGHLARVNPEYRGRAFDSIEHELKAGWTEPVSSRHGDWNQVREYAREAYTQDFSVTSREAAIHDRSPDDSLSDRLTNTDRPAANRVAGAYDSDRDDRGDDGNAEARLALPVSRR